MSPIASRVPYMTAMGNHEQDWPTAAGEPYEDRLDSGGECGVPTAQRWPMPAVDPLEGWYSFAHGPVMFVVLNTEWPAGPGTPQYAFLARALAVDRAATPWLVVGGHRPMYSGNITYQLDGIIGMDEVEDLFWQHEVDLFLAGHVHNVQLTCPIYRGTCVQACAGCFAGTVHAVIGNGGQDLTPFPADRAPWSVFQQSTLGYNEFEANRTHAALRFFADDDGQLLYERRFTKPAQVVV